MASNESDERDQYTFDVANHGVDPSDMPVTAEVVGVSEQPVDPAVGAGGNGGRGGGRRREEHDDNFSWRDTLIWCGIPILVVILIRVLLVGFYEIPSRSMESTIEPGDRVVTSKLSPRPFGLKRGDVVVFHDPANWLAGEQSGNPLAGDYLIKRVIGLPGDTVECEGAGQPIKVNGVAVNETAYLKAGVDPSAFPFSVTVSANHIFVMGDNRANSADSRYHQDDGDKGLVPMSDVVGVGIARYWPLSRISGLDAHHEVFSNVPDAGSDGSAGNAA
ncbi:signal peptidase [Bifidobacterium sp. UTCIF-37]|uniref:Signal peptidase I n=2 Tax=Bifidobacterium callitrichos TaxID=762209 RepID=A0A2T3G8V3_9BIFI|nr:MULTISPECIES: signal peptidase I [Bifidobacterium]KFI54631.1 signal peptidase I [Bifidobacterium callitrichos DSM 23973]PST45926.1 signal peptidase I [Bifidobacterium callitrichos]TPF85799.1 signal peptidase [Bifidobacterium sp. UTCIF-37]TPF87878.1 signal peptidase [Bifidobacterium sp. UTCIF-38]